MYLIINYIKFCNFHFLKICHISLLNCTIFINSAFLRSTYILIRCFPRDMSYRIARIIERLVYWYWYIGNNMFHHKIILDISTITVNNFNFADLQGMSIKKKNCIKKEKKLRGFKLNFLMGKSNFEGGYIFFFFSFLGL